MTPTTSEQPSVPPTPLKSRQERRTPGERVADRIADRLTATLRQTTGSIGVASEFVDAQHRYGCIRLEDAYQARYYVVRYTPEKRLPDFLTYPDGSELFFLSKREGQAFIAGLLFGERSGE